MVHVAGTNGKGSLIAILKAVLEAAGLSVHAYTSPHLVRFNERIAVSGRTIADAALGAVLERCEQANGGRPITYFEITTAAAFLAFADAPADVVLLETGLGGRLDATNVIAKPALCAITPVSRDHVQFLGEDIAAIAFEKAGILKPGVTCIVAPQTTAAIEVIETRAGAVGAPLLCSGRDWRVEAADGGMAYIEDTARLELPLPALAGEHQMVNAGAAIACARRLSGVAVDAVDAVDAAAIARGLGQVHWPARLQRLTDGVLAAIAGPDWELWLDGGHNRAAAEALARVAEGWRDRPLYLVFGAMNSRDPGDFLAPLAGHIRGLRAVAIPREQNSLGPDEIVAAAGGAGLDAAPSDSLADAVGDIVTSGGTGGRILICGSLYLAGAALVLDS